MKRHNPPDSSGNDCSERHCHGLLAYEIRGLKRTFWGDPDIEIKSNWIRQPTERQKRNAPHGIGLEEIDQLVSALYRWLPRSPLTLLASVVDKPLMQSR